jgi:hypothetical protein
MRLSQGLTKSMSALAGGASSIEGESEMCLDDLETFCADFYKSIEDVKAVRAGHATAAAATTTSTAVTAVIGVASSSAAVGGSSGGGGQLSPTSSGGPLSPSSSSSSSSSLSSSGGSSGVLETELWRAALASIARMTASMMCTTNHEVPAFSL